MCHQARYHAIMYTCVAYPGILFDDKSQRSVFGKASIGNFVFSEDEYHAELSGPLSMVKHDSNEFARTLHGLFH